MRKVKKSTYGRIGNYTLTMSPLGNIIQMVMKMYENLPREVSAGAACWKRSPEGIKYLILLQVKSGRWSMPKGHMEKGETELQTATREIYEETGLRPKIDPVLIGDVCYPTRHGTLKVNHFFTAECDDSPITAQKEEVREYRWETKEEAMKLLDPKYYGEFVEKADRYIRENLLDK